MALRYRLIAAELTDLGIDVNCAPMLDVPTAAAHDIILNRCYGRDADTVAEIGRAVADSLLAGGVLPIIKHIPGHGRATLDSHLELPRVDASRCRFTNRFHPVSPSVRFADGDDRTYFIPRFGRRGMRDFFHAHYTDDTR